MRTLIARAAVLATAAAALAVPAAAFAGTGPVLAWAPATAGAYSFGTPSTGQAVAKTFTLTNTGGPASSALKITLTGSSAFAKTADTCTGTSLGPAKSCAVTITYTAPQVPGQASQATLTATAIKPAATAALALSGAAAKATPAITTASSPGGPAGTTITDTATLAGGYQPGGSIEFKLYPTTDCSGSPVDDQTVTVNGNGSYTTPNGAALTQAGTYSWTAAYSGDPANNAAATSCGTDTVTITKAAPALTQQANASCYRPDCPTPFNPITDTATLSGGNQPTGTIEFLLYLGGSCSGNPVADETVTVDGNGNYTTPTGFTNFFVDLDISYSWTASYSGDASNNPAATGCTGGGVYYEVFG